MKKKPKVRAPGQWLEDYIASTEQIAEVSSQALGLSDSAWTLRKLMVDPEVDALLLLKADDLQHIASLVFGIVENAKVIREWKNAETASALGTKSQKVQALAREARKAEIEAHVLAYLDKHKDAYGVLRMPKGAKMWKKDAFEALKEQLPEVGENKLKDFISRLWPGKQKRISSRK